MKKRVRKVKERRVEFYDHRGVLGELEERPVEFALEEELRRQILGGMRTRLPRYRRRRLADMIGRGGKVPLALSVNDLLKRRSKD